MKLLSIILSALISTFSRAPAMASIDADEYSQTVLYNIVIDHLEDKNDTDNKKVLFIGYDGFRTDCLPLITDETNGAVSSVMRDGCLINTFAGGTAEASQQTSTAAGWCSILTGKGAEESGVWNNNSVKRDSAETFLTAACKMGYSCAFISSYPSHFENTLVRDIRTSKKNGMKCDYIRTTNDKESERTALSLLKKGKHDVIFVIFEYTDDAGHKRGFSSEEADYRKACKSADAAGYELLRCAAETDKEIDDRLVVITTDHGGIGRRHGGQSKDERSTWAAVSKPFSEIIQ